ncbi:MAG: FIST C-terminal domain-containing protein [Acidobacteria bacterium]|nr:FIST C-terminal domain-containing protein [Acidobacteriota bacterium]
MPKAGEMKWVSTVCEDVDTAAAAAKAGEAILSGLGGKNPDLTVVFVSLHHKDAFEKIPALLGDRFGTGVLVGCTAGAVIGGGREVEERPGLSVTAAILPGVDLIPFHCDSADLPEPIASTDSWEKLVGVESAKKPHFILLPDPFTFEAERFLTGLDQIFPQSQKVGGLASGARVPGLNSLYLGGEVFSSGLVGVAMCGNISVDTIVAQGCRPIGEPMFVTSCDGNLVLEMDGKPIFDKLKDLYRSLDPDDKDLFRHSLFLGVVMRDQQTEYQQGDFLIRNLIGMNAESGSLAVGATLKENQVVQFHLRDAKTSAEDLDHMLSRYHETAGKALPQGSLMFSCLGRGRNLYGRSDHDTDSFRRRLGSIPLGGFFCNGEIGPVQGKTFLHGYTSSFALFRNGD